MSISKVVIDKSILTNLLALLLVFSGLMMAQSQFQALVLNTGLFALSGALTNWLAIHMLFEKVPGFYGSGVIPSRFEEFKLGIKALIMEQFFNPENVRNFFARLKKEDTKGGDSSVKNMLDAVDFNIAFESLVEVIMASSFGGMLSMVGGVEALKPLKEPFAEKMKEFMANLAEDKDVLDKFKDSSLDSLLVKVEELVDQRLEELTPELVKEIIQQMIRQHLGWLVVWGGVLGGLIGLLVTVFIAG